MSRRGDVTPRKPVESKPILATGSVVIGDRYNSFVSKNSRGKSVGRSDSKPNLKKGKSDYEYSK